MTFPTAEDKLTARAMAHKALQSGKIEARTECEDCGRQAHHMHHPDYAEPLNVVWLCRRCHGVRHSDKKDIWFRVVSVDRVDPETDEVLAKALHNSAHLVVETGIDWLRVDDEFRFTFSGLVHKGEVGDDDG